MTINWIILSLTIAACIVLLAFLVIRNRKDEEEYEQFLHNNEHFLNEEKEVDDD